jgi:hypothetical protein
MAPDVPHVNHVCAHGTASASVHAISVWHKGCRQVLQLFQHLW